ncbi:hypothetical protein [Gimesia sp.]|uniref:hypothetical protein n=1 Tax=Gimesia sp. TaxID=2024833 RepID=UPI0032F08FA2
MKILNLDRDWFQRQKPGFTPDMPHVTFTGCFFFMLKGRSRTHGKAVFQRHSYRQKRPPIHPSI